MQDSPTTEEDFSSRKAGFETTFLPFGYVLLRSTQSEQTRLGITGVLCCDMKLLGITFFIFRGYINKA
jgi:hypothetical protein